MEMQGFPPSPS